MIVCCDAISCRSDCWSSAKLPTHHRFLPLCGGSCALDRVSANIKLLPATYSKSKSYLCRRNNIVCKRLGAEASAFFVNGQQRLMICFHDHMSGIHVCVETLQCKYNSSRYCRNQLQYRFMFARPNNKVKAAALTRSYERTVQF